MVSGSFSPTTTTGLISGERAAAGTGGLHRPGRAWLKGRDEGDALHVFVEELGDARNGDGFNAPWNEIYDIADADRVWIGTV